MVKISPIANTIQKFLWWGNLSFSIFKAQSQFFFIFSGFKQQSNLKPEKQCLNNTWASSKGYEFHILFLFIDCLD